MTDARTQGINWTSKIVGVWGIVYKLPVIANLGWLTESGGGPSDDAPSVTVALLAALFDSVPNFGRSFVTAVVYQRTLAPETAVVSNCCFKGSSLSCCPLITAGTSRRHCYIEASTFGRGSRSLIQASIKILKECFAARCFILNIISHVLRVLVCNSMSS